MAFSSLIMMEAKDSLGIAFLKLPPSIETILIPKSTNSINKRFMILLAFPLSRWMSIPECPPFRPFTESSNANSDDWVETC